MTISDADIEAMLDDELVQRRTTVMFLRNGGATWSQVSKVVNVSIATCRKDYNLVCRDINGEDRTHTIARHRAIFFDICRANYANMMRGDKDAAMTILRAMADERLLLGLNQPMQLMASVNTEDFAAEAARLITYIQRHDVDTLKELTRGRQPTLDGTVESVVLDPGGAEGVQETAGDHVPVAGAAVEPERGAVPDDSAAVHVLDDGDGWSNIGD